jgi:hypothetical protein
MDEREKRQEAARTFAEGLRERLAASRGLTIGDLMDRGQPAEPDNRERDDSREEE